MPLEQWWRNSKCTFDERFELIDRLEASRLVYVVGPERDAEERAVWDDSLDEMLVLGTAQSLHLAVDQVDVEVGKLDVVAACLFQTATKQTVTDSLPSPKL